MDRGEIVWGVRLIKMRLNEMCSGICIGKYLPYNLGEIG
jgi:hypothetical protein